MHGGVTAPSASYGSLDPGADVGFRDSTYYMRECSLPVPKITVMSVCESTRADNPRMGEATHISRLIAEKRVCEM